MKRSQYAFLFIVVLLCATSAHALCRSGEVSLGGDCRDQAWVEANLLGGNPPIAFGACRLVPLPTITPVCSLWVAELESETSLGFKAKIHMLNDAACTGSNCLGSYTRVARLNLEFQITHDALSATGTLKIAASKLGSALAGRGSIEWNIRSSSFQSTFYDALGNTYSGGGYTVSDDLWYFGPDRCDSTVTEMIANGAPDYPLYRIVHEGSKSLAARKSTVIRDPQGKEKGSIATLGGLTTTIPRAVGQTVGAWSEKRKLCTNLHGTITLHP